MITLHYNDANGTAVSVNIHEDDSSYRYRAIMQKPQLILKFSLPEYIEFPIGTWCTYQNEKYALWYPQNITKNGTRNIAYTLTLGTDEERMGLCKMRNTVDHRLKWSMCAKPHEFIEEIVKNLNLKEGAENWSVGTCIESTEKTVEFNHTYIDEALQSIADTFETEWEIVDKCIHLHKVEYYKDDPLPLSYGKGNGFIPGVGRTTQSDEMPVKRLYVQGGEENIDRSKYGSAELLLPKSQSLKYEGRTYTTDADGLYIERTDKISDAVKEDSLDCSEIYPSRVGTITHVVEVAANKNWWDITDSYIPNELDFNNYIIEGETATIIFQSGMLAGKEFEFKYKHTRRVFELVPQEIDGQTMPNATYHPAEGDTYAVFGIMLPDAYICNNADQTGASWDMFREAAKYLYENEDQKFTFTGTLQGLWAKRNWLRVGERLKVGSYILFSDDQFAKDGQTIRITGIKDFLYSPYSPTIEISNSVSGGIVYSQLKQIDNTEVVISDTKKEILQFTKRRFRDAQETITALQDSLLSFDEGIKPITVLTMAMLVGDESLQFRFVESKENLTLDADWQVTYDNTHKQLHCPHGFLQHMTLGISSISSSHEASKYKCWEMTEYTSPVLTEAEQVYYLYAIVSSGSTSEKGEFTLSEKAVDMNAQSGKYYLLVGILNSESEEERSFVTLYGFTEVLPGRITTDRIVSTDGKTFMDLAAGSAHIGNDTTYIDWNNETNDALTIHNADIDLYNNDNEQTVQLKSADGSGFLASGKLTWTKDGKLFIAGFVLPAVVYITEENYKDYMTDFSKEITSGVTYWNRAIDFTKTGELVHIMYWPDVVIKEDDHIVNTLFTFPSIRNDSEKSYTREEKNQARQYIGHTIRVFNHTSKSITVNGYFGSDGVFINTASIGSSKIVAFTCYQFQGAKSASDAALTATEVVAWKTESIAFVEDAE